MALLSGSSITGLNPNLSAAAGNSSAKHIIDSWSPGPRDVHVGLEVTQSGPLFYRWWGYNPERNGSSSEVTQWARVSWFRNLSDTGHPIRHTSYWIFFFLRSNKIWEPSKYQVYNLCLCKDLWILRHISRKSQTHTLPPCITSALKLSPQPTVNSTTPAPSLVAAFSCYWDLMPENVLLFWIPFLITISFQTILPMAELINVFQFHLILKPSSKDFGPIL